MSSFFSAILKTGFIALFSALAFSGSPAAAQSSLVNVSYDPTRELYRAYNKTFADYWQQEKGEKINMRTTHGGSGAQARTVIDGLNADVVTLALEADINAIVKQTGKIRADWRGTLPNNNAPYTSVIVFLVRKGNPKAITDWQDLIKDGVEVITPNPKISGGARWNLLAALAWAQQYYAGDAGQATNYVRTLYRHVPVLDTGARGSTMSFVQRGMGDVLLAWENEALLALDERGGENFEIVVPSVSILAEPPVAIVDANVEVNGSREIATAYLDYLYSKEGQTLAAHYGYRPFRPELVDEETLQKFQAVKLVTIDDFGGWEKVQPEFFGDGGFFDQIYSGTQ